MVWKQVCKQEGAKVGMELQGTCDPIEGSLQDEDFQRSKGTTVCTATCVS